MSSRFHLHKWYFDSIDKDGKLTIAYVGKIYWKRIPIYFSSLLMKHKGIASTSSLKKVDLPEITGNSIQHKNHLFQAEASISNCIIKETLIEVPEGKIQWNCYCQGGPAFITTKDLAVKGKGYTEELIMTIKPWELKIKELKWGRFVSDKNQITWIEWEGEWERFYIWHNGAKFLKGNITDQEVEFENYRLVLKDTFTLRSGTLLSNVLKRFPLFKKLFPLKALLTDETKIQSKGELYLNKQLIEEGWCIFETVKWL